MYDTFECPFFFIECLECGHLADYAKVPEDSAVHCFQCNARLAEPEGE